jgi:hypothetical protein
MRTLIAVTVAAVLLAAAAPAANAKAVPYKGKTTGGHEMTFTYSKGKMRNVSTAVPMTCLSIQGGGAPISGAELWQFTWIKVPLTKYTWSETSKPSLYYSDVKRTHTVTTRRARNGKISGSIRVQYSFLIPKYPIPSFAIYSCLGNTKFSAKPTR